MNISYFMLSQVFGYYPTPLEFDGVVEGLIVKLNENTGPRPASDTTGYTDPVARPGGHERAIAAIAAQTAGEKHSPPYNTYSCDTRATTAQWYYPCDGGWLSGDCTKKPPAVNNGCCGGRGLVPFINEPPNQWTNWPLNASTPAVWNYLCGIVDMTTTHPQRVGWYYRVTSFRIESTIHLIPPSGSFLPLSADQTITIFINGYQTNKSATGWTGPDGPHGTPPPPPQNLS